MGRPPHDRWRLSVHRVNAWNERMGCERSHLVNCAKLSYAHAVWSDEAAS